MRYILVLVLLCSCSGDDTNDVITTPPPEYTLCEYVEGVCVVEESFSSMDIDYQFLAWVVNTLEYETNFYYPVLDFELLAEQNEIILLYKWANINTQHQGDYNDADVVARVFLRKGDAITSKMECMDRYYIVAHELLHFLVSRHLLITVYENNDVHYVPFIFKHWAILDNLPVDYTVEGRLYVMIARYCDSLQ